MRRWGTRKYLSRVLTRLNLGNLTCSTLLRWAFFLTQDTGNSRASRGQSVRAFTVRVVKSHHMVSNGGVQVVKKETCSTDYCEKLFIQRESLSDLRKKTISSAGAAVFGRIVTYGVNMISVVVLARLVAPSDFGLVAMVTAPFMILLDFGSLGLGEAIVQAKTINHKQISMLFWIDVGVSLGIAALLVVLSPLVSLFYNETRLQAITIAISSTVVLNGISIQHLALMRRNMQFYRISAIQVASSIGSVTLAVVLAWLGWGYWAIVARQVTLFALTAIGAWILCAWRPSLPKERSNVAPLLKFGVQFVGGNSILYFSKNLDKVLLGWHQGSKPLGYYERAYHLFSMPLNQIIFPLGNVAFSALSKLSGEPERFRRYYLKLLSILAFVGFPLGITLSLIGPDLVVLLLGSKWEETGHIFSVMSLTVGVSLMYMTFGWINLSLGRADRNLRWIIFATFVYAISYSIGLKFGSLGLAIGVAATPCILLMPALLYAGAPINLKLSSILLTTWRYFFAAFSAGIFVWLLFYRTSTISLAFSEHSIFLRICLPSLSYLGLYLVFVVFLYQGTQPIAEFVRTVGEMIPSIGNKRHI